MKQYIKHFIILALLLVGSLTAWADETVTFTFYRESENSIPNFYLVYNNTNYKLNAENTGWFTTAITTAGGVTVTIDYSPSTYGAVVQMKPTEKAYGDGYRYYLNQEYAFTMSFSSTSKYISQVKVYCTSADNNWERNAYNNTQSCKVQCEKYDRVYRVDVTLTDTKPVLDIADATISGIADSYDYTGSAIEPAPSVTYNTGTIDTGTLTLAAGTDYDISYKNNTNVGTATMTLTGKGDYSGTLARNFTINKATPVVTGLTLTTADYNGTAQPLCSGATTTGGTLMYSTDESTWNENVPTATDIGTYNVYYKVVGNTNYNDFPSTLAGQATINPVTLNYGCLAVTVQSASDNSLAISESDGTADEDISIPADFVLSSITMSRTFTVGKAATVMLPFSIATSKVSGGKFYSFIGVDKNDTAWEVMMLQVDPVSGTLQAHTPYIFMPTATTMTFNLGGETVTLKATDKQTYTVTP